MVTNTRPSGKKWSQFTKQTTVSGTASINMEDGGKNVTISVDDFASQYQLADLVVEGDGTPVLQVAGSQNKIRSIESSGGVSVAVGPTNNIQLGVDLENGSSGGAETFVDVAASPIVARTIQAGAGITVGQAGDVIQISTSALPAPVTTVVVNNESDFPTQDATTITLDAGVQFIIGASFSTGKNFIVGNNSLITGNNVLSPVLTYTGTATMFTSVDASFAIKDIQIDHPNSDGFDFTDTVGGLVLFLNEKVRTVSGKKYGTFSDLQTVLIEGSSALSVTDGITVSGSNFIIFSIDKFFLGSVEPTFIGVDFGSSLCQNIEIIDMIASGGAGSIAIKGAANSANMPVNAVATVNGCNFSGITNPLDTITVEDIRWKFNGNSKIPDTIEDALISLTSNLTATVITSINTAVKAAGTWVCERESFFTCDATGRATFIGERGTTVPVDITTSIASASGTNKNITVYLGLNGVKITNSAATNRVGATDPRNTAVIWQITLNTGDYLELFVENNTDTTDLVVKNAILRVR